MKIVTYLSSFFLLLNSAISAEISTGYIDDSTVITSFRLKKIDLYTMIKTQIWKPEYEFDRKSDLQNPGFYYVRAGSMLDDKNIAAVYNNDIFFLKILVKPILSEKYYSDNIFDFTKNYYLPNLERKEFFFNIKSDSVFIRFSGWYNEFVHIIIFTEYDSKEGFIDKAKHFFNLPPLDTINIIYNEDILDNVRDDFFYEYIDEKVDFKLVGYPVLYSKPEDPEHLTWDYVVLDLTIYAEKE